MLIEFLANKIPWFGKYSGYECIDQYFPNNIRTQTFYANDASFTKKVLGKLYQHRYSINDTDTLSIANGMTFLNRKTSKAVKHILYLDAHTHLLSMANKKQLRTLAGTIHIPFENWKENNLNRIASLQHAIMLYSSGLKKFQSYLPDTKLHVIKHGVDTSFFRPGVAARDKTKLLCVGHYLRNFDMLERVIVKLNAQHRSLSFHLVMPERFRLHPSLTALSKLANVFFYENLSDDELLLLYQTCGMLVMPMENSGANTAIVQAIACGIPIVTTNTGGIASYGGGEVFETVENNSDSDMLNLVLQYIDDRNYADKCSLLLREYAVENLDWYLIAKQHVDFYEQIYEAN